MKQVFKLCPIEATDEMLIKGQKFGGWRHVAKEANAQTYANMTADCEAVEVVDVEQYHGTSPHQEQMFIELTKKFLNIHPDDDETARAWINYVARSHLIQNGHKIVKEVCDE